MRCWIVASLCALVAACGGASTSTDTHESTGLASAVVADTPLGLADAVTQKPGASSSGTPPSVVPPALSASTPAPFSETFSNLSELQSYLQKQVNYLAVASQGVGDIAAISSEVKAPEVSATNTYVSGVDEADRVKTVDGQAYWLRQSHQDIVLYDRWDIAAPTMAKARLEQVDLGVDGSTPIHLHGTALDAQVDWAGLYTDEAGVTALGGQWQYSPEVLRGDTLNTEPYLGPAALATVHVQRFDRSLSRLVQRTFDGSLVNSRRIGDNLLLLLRHVNQPIIDGQLPSSLSGADNTALFQAENCMRPPHETPDNYAVQLFSVVTLNAQTLDLKAARCGVSSYPQIHVTGNSLYLIEQQWAGDKQTSYIGKFALGDTGSLNFRGWTSVEGVVQTGYGLAERGAHLLLFVSQGWGQNTRHYLHTLGDTEQGFVRVNRYPENDSQRIGKPGESLYGMRFVKDRAYAVTFQRTDPLYAFDISNPVAPRAVGELSLPGFSELLHPLGDKYLLGLGSMAAENGRVEGFQATLFDVSEDLPRVLSQVQIARAYQSLRWDHHGLTTLQVGDQLRVALPLYGYLDNGQWGQWTELLSVTQSAQPAVTSVGTLDAGQATSYWSQPRSILTSTRVFDLRDTLHYASWASPRRTHVMAFP